MRKITAMTLIIFILTSFMLVPADAADAPTLIFEMDLSDASNVVGEAVKVVKATTATAANLDPGDPIVTDRTISSVKHAPIFGKIEGKNTPYLTFADEANTTPAEGKDMANTNPWANSAARIIVPLNENINLADAEAVTVETWVKPGYLAADTTRGPCNIMTINKKDGLYDKKNTAFRVRWHKNDESGLAMYPDMTVNVNARLSHGLLGSNEAKWTHIVITRKWVKSDTQSDATEGEDGYWESSLYVNGQDCGTVSSENSNDAALKVKQPNFATMRWTDLVIGGSEIENTGQSFRGQIATMKVYDGLLSLDDAKTSYMATRESFKAVADMNAIADLEPGTKNMTVSFTAPVSAKTLTNENIVIKRGDVTLRTTVTPIDVTEEETATAATITFLDKIDIGEEYEIDYSKLRDGNNEILKSEKKTFKSKASDFGAPTVTYTGGSSLADATKMDVAMTVTDADKAGTFTLAMIVVNAEGRIVKFINDTKTVDGTTGQAVLSVSSGTDLGAGYTVKAVAWRVDETDGAVAVSKTITAKKPQ